jgi:AcrR family transcriptional regulator
MQVMLEPRKVPVQARSTASVEAILDATLQVLLSVGRVRLTTTRVALRAGVSVGTLYQYFPNKSALLQAVLRRHLDEVTEAVERVCAEQAGMALREMVTALIAGFFRAKTRDTKTSVALYAVSSDVDGAKVVRQMGMRSNKAIVRMLETSSEELRIDAQVVGSMLQGLMVGVTRRKLESGLAETWEVLERESIAMGCAYVEGCRGGFGG